VVGETPSRIDGIPLQTEVAGAVQDVWCGVGLGPAADVGAKIVRRDFKSGGVSRLIRSTGRDVLADNVEHGRGGAVEVGECSVERFSHCLYGPLTAAEALLQQYQQTANFQFDDRLLRRGRSRSLDGPEPASKISVENHQRGQKSIEYASFNA
jgi:hypothetical protein